MTVHYHLNGQLFTYGVVPVAMISIEWLVNILYKKIPYSVRIRSELVILSFITAFPVVMIAVSVITLTTPYEDLILSLKNNDKLMPTLSTLT